MTPEDARAELERVLASPGFINSPRLRRLFAHLVKCSIANELDRLKESLTGVEVFDRPPGYDLKDDSIVRATARQLRFKLTTYYAEHPGPPALRIELPKGSYLVRFRTKDTEPA
jgi:hypothetical protein